MGQLRGEKCIVRGPEVARAELEEVISWLQSISFPRDYVALSSIFGQSQSVFPFALKSLKCY